MLAMVWMYTHEYSFSDSCDHAIEWTLIDEGM